MFIPTFIRYALSQQMESQINKSRWEKLSQKTGIVNLKMDYGILWLREMNP